MPAKGNAQWQGDLKNGSGTFTAGDSLSGNYTYKSRFEDGEGANPEQLIGAAHAACFSMALSNMLAEAGHADPHGEGEQRENGSDSAGSHRRKYAGRPRDRWMREHEDRSEAELKERR